MTRRSSLALAAVLSLLFPLTLASQSSESGGAADSTPRATNGCSSYMADAADGGGATSSPRGADTVIHGFDPANLDRSISPCDDFYKFADGGWIKNNPVPPDRAAWATFNKLRDHNEEALHQILEEAAKDQAAAPGSNWQKIGDFYSSCMDENQVESAGLKPLAPELQAIADIKDTAGVQAEIARLQRSGVNAVFEFGSEQDLKDSTQVIAGAGQGGLGMPDRQYYVDDDDRSKQLRTAYIQHVTNMFKLMGDDDATSAAEAKSVLDVETALAKASKKREELRDPETNYHRLTLAQLGDLTPHFSWTSYFKEIGAPALDSTDIGQPDFFKQLDSGLASVPLDDWKIYLRWHLVHAVAASLPGKFVDENFDFYGRTLTGAKQLLPRWHRCVMATDGQLGEALGQYYVQRNFPPEAKAQALAMVQNLIAALHDDLSTLDWMSPATRVQASKKLDAITLKIGYPDKWRDYSRFKVDRGPYMENVLRGKAFEVARDLGKIGKPVDRTEWGMTPPTVNAYYNPSMNEIVFPAGILQPPFFDPKADDAINYGGMGSVIGHEMTHGFDDQGAKFDGQGNLNDWWTPEDLKNFQERGECIAKQFEAFEIEPGLHGNGKLEEGESIADLGGMTIAHAAFLKTLAGKPDPAPIDGFTADQRFFLGWAQIWAANLRPEYARLIAKTDPHPLNPFRGNGPLSNTAAFAKAFGCGADSKMVRPEGQRCRIW
ncbi:MAG TPA: M13 family metallopeptidase [Candidatus Acidoferrales bacterium]|nr:M13 family metallopeptidase [Candidatus Acidoferrales bacterium]